MLRLAFLQAANHALRILANAGLIDVLASLASTYSWVASCHSTNLAGGFSFGIGVYSLRFQKAPISRPANRHAANKLVDR
jgi:hypothetical protein